MIKRCSKMGLSGVVAMVVVSAVAAAQDAVPVGAVPPSVPQYAYAPEQEGWFLAAVFWLYYVLVWLVAVAGVVMVAVLWFFLLRGSGAFLWQRMPPGLPYCC